MNAVSINESSNLKKKQSILNEGLNLTFLNHQITTTTRTAHKFIKWLNAHKLPLMVCPYLITIYYYFKSIKKHTHNQQSQTSNYKIYHQNLLESVCYRFIMHPFKKFLKNIVFSSPHSSSAKAHRKVCPFRLWPLHRSRWYPVLSLQWCHFVSRSR